VTRITVKAVRSSSHSPTIARSETDREDGSGELARIRLPLDGHDSRPRMEAADDVPFCISVCAVMRPSSSARLTRTSLCLDAHAPIWLSTGGCGSNLLTLGAES